MLRALIKHWRNFWNHINPNLDISNAILVVLANTNRWHSIEEIQTMLINIPDRFSILPNLDDLEDTGWIVSEQVNVDGRRVYSIAPGVKDYLVYKLWKPKADD